MEQLRREMHDLHLSVQKIAESQVRLGVLVEKELASREWVTDKIVQSTDPLRLAIEKLASALESQSRDIHKLTLLSEETHHTQDALFRERADNERKIADAKIAALERSQFREVIKKAWFWILAFIAVPPAIMTAYEAIQHLIGMFK